MTELSERAKNRLKLAANFLRKDGYKFDDGNFYDLVLATIETLPKPEKERLLGLVDWVEEL